jgi:dTDP-4-amino-4,6-dideoxygalactose transaminase
MSPIKVPYEHLGQLNAPYLDVFTATTRNVIEKGWYILGNEVANFETAFATWLGAKHCIGVANGLDALILPLLAADYPKGAEVIVPSNTYIATILAIVQAGLKPILAEPNPETYLITAETIQPLINSNTVAIMVVHLYGRACAMEPIMNLAQQHGVDVYEDCAQSHGAKHRGKHTGTFGKSSAFSFYPTKNLGALGDAGAIVTNDDNLAVKLKAFRNYGSEKKYYNQYKGLNSRLDELQAALLNIKLQDLAALNEHKKQLAQLYRVLIQHPEIVLPSVDNDTEENVYHIFPIRCQRRDALKAHLLQHGIATEIHYPVPPHQQEGYQDVFKATDNYPIASMIHATELSLPISLVHNVDDVRFVANSINSFK